MANFTISQAVDGSTITITDTRSIVSTYVLTVQSSSMEDTSTQTLSLSAEQIVDLATGLSLKPSDIGYSEAVWVDGVFTFTVTTNDLDAEELVKAFMEIAAGEVFANALNYRLYLDTKEKSAILEQIRLLNNMGRAAKIGSVAAFSENLELLQNLLA